MKNEQKSSPNGTQHQDAKNTGNTQRDSNQQQKGNTPPPSSTGNNQSSSPQKSNISVDNDGKIGKAHDQWNNNNQNDQNQKDQQQKNTGNKLKSDKTVTEPKIDSPIYDPEKTEKKIPQMESNKNSK